MQSIQRCFHAHSTATMVLIVLACSMHAWSAETVLHSFSGADGANPYSGLISDNAGNLYGTTSSGGGMFNAGTVFELVYSGGRYSETVLHSFTGGSDGGFPTAALISDASGNLFGTTEFGGSGTCFGRNGCGVVFELVKANSYSETVLYEFTGGRDGGSPFASLAFDSSGNLYGTATCGGSSGCSSGGGNGVVFELVKANNYGETVLFQFTGSSDGGTPVAPVIIDISGNLYGTTEFGGTQGCSGQGCGVVFELVKASGYSEVVLHTFTGGNDGGLPFAPVVADTSGNLFGTATCGGNLSCTVSGSHGVIFEIIKSDGSYHVRHTFLGSDGSRPVAGLVFDSQDNNLYGTTYVGGAHDLGTVFRIQSSGSGYTVLQSFPGGSNGSNPSGGVNLVEHKGGCTGRCGWGTTLNGGTFDLGIAFAVSPI